MSCCSNSQEKIVTNNSCCGSEGAKEKTDTCSTSESRGSHCCGTEEDQTTTISWSSEKDLTNCCSTEVDGSSCCSNHEEASAVMDSAREKQKVEYKVYGMDCPSCASTIEKGLQRLKNVISAKVNYNTEKLQVVADGGYSPTQVENTIQNLGFTAERIFQNNNMRIYDVQGMDCGSCAKSIENHLIKVPGVNDVQVSFAAGNMRVEHTNPVDDVLKEVAKIGFHASLQTRDNKSVENKQSKRELLKTVVSGILISTGFIGSYFGLPTLASTILFAISIVISGYQPVKSAYYAVKSRSLDMNVLMSSGAIGAAIIGEWFEGATVVWLFSLGIYLQNRSMDQTRKSIRSLMNMAPSMAWVKVDRELIGKPVEEVSVGDTIVIKPGDKIPLDGNIIQGESSINQAPITGESLPVDKTVGDAVYAGTMNESGSLEVAVTKLIEDTTLSKIIHLVEEAQDQKAPTEAFIDRFASIYTPIVFILALLVMIFPPLFGFGLWSEWIYKGLALLVVACPCALVISTPVAIVSAIGNAAKNGVLIKGGTFLEVAGEIDAVAFDKTGTLTEGKPKVSEIHPINTSADELLSIAYALESHSSHPIAKTIVQYAQERNISQVEGSLFKNIVGRGVEATINGKDYYAGNRQLFEEMSISLSDVEHIIESMQQHGSTIVIIGKRKKILGVIGVTDTLRPSTVKTLNHLRKVGMEQIVMLTGDNDGTAKRISGQTSINRYFAELLPEDKVTALKQLQSEGNKVAMVGDGINDAPALATADLGIAMGGTGTDTAMETADVVLMADNLDKLPYTIKLSRKALTIIKQNIWFSLIIKFIALGLIFPGWLTLWMAVLSDTGAAIIVILNALRLLKSTNN